MCQIGLTFGVGGLLFGVTAGKYRIAGGAESLPQRLLLPVRALHGGLPLGLCELGGFDGDTTALPILAQGGFDATATQQVRGIGRLAVDSAIKLAAGEETEFSRRAKDDGIYD